MHQPTLVKAYPTQAAFAMDEQQLGEHGWSVTSTASTDHKAGHDCPPPSALCRPQAATPIIVTDRGASQPNAVRPAQWGPRLTRIHVVRNLWT